MVASVASRNGSYDNDSGCGRWEGRDGEARDSQAHVYCLTKAAYKRVPPESRFGWDCVVDNLEATWSVVDNLEAIWGVVDNLEAIWDSSWPCKVH